jgi:hypothetical protein
VKAVWGQKVLAGWLDHLLAKQAWNGQLHDGPDDPQRPDNLYRPVPGHQAADGSFTGRARSRRTEIWITTHPEAVWAGAALAARRMMRPRRSAAAVPDAEKHQEEKAGDEQHRGARDGPGRHPAAEGMFQAQQQEDDHK